MKILTKDKCTECNGAGVVTNPIWLEFFQVDEQFGKDNNGQMMSPEQCEAWFRERGYGKLPPEEPTCSECEGAGEIEKWMTISDKAISLLTQ
jgi:DnaJ-class molecular chaperone